MNSYDFFRGKRITVLGLGLLGRAVGDVEFLAQSGAELIVTDKKSIEELAESVSRLRKYKNIRLHLGDHAIGDFINCDMVIKAAGVRLDSPEVVAARRAGVPVYMSTVLFAKFAMEAGVLIVGITGTRGKSTVAHMIYHALVRARKRARLGGNVRGISTLAMLPEIKRDDIAVLELDSWQLQGFGDLRISPNIAVITNLMPDHLNYYPNMETYFNDKANIFRYQKKDDALFVGASIAKRAREVHPPIRQQIPEPIPSGWRLKIPGKHNRENASLAASVLRALGLSEAAIRAGLESFGGVEGRLQLMREIRGVKIYNDNNATTPDATIAALQALDSGNKNIILIMGGDDKALDMNTLVFEIEKSCKNVVLLDGTGTQRFQSEKPHLRLLEDSPFSKLKSAVDAALQKSRKGDVILFSPAFASFGMFKNEYDRNDQFINIIRAL